MSPGMETELTEIEPCKSGDGTGGEPPLVVVAEDDRATRLLMCKITRDAGYRVAEAADGRTALDLAAASAPDAILLDIVMPGLSGIEVCRQLQADPELARIPVILLTASDDREARHEGLQAGAMDFLTKPADDVELMCRLGNLVRLKQAQDALLRENLQLEAKVNERTRELAVALVEVEKAYGRLRDMTLESIYRLTYAAEYRDETTAIHTQRIAHYARSMAEELGWDEERCELLFYASPMHDIGKIGIPDSILLKAGPLSAGERGTMRNHTVIGAKLLSGSRQGVLQAAESIALNHHESWDGSGYPQGLHGEEIPIEGRIVMVCDVYDALRMERPYKKAYSHEEAIKIMAAGRERVHAGQFDPTLRELFLDLNEHMNGIFAEHKEYDGLPPVSEWLAGRV